MKLSQYIKEHGLTDAEMARRAGLSVGGLRKLKRGERNPGLEVMMAIAKATGNQVTPNDFAGIAFSKESQGAAA